MNNPQGRGASRFIRGRGRGGGAYRPYFYFRRNGRTIPAGNGSRGDGDVASRTGAASKGAHATKRRGSGTNNAMPNSSFTRPEFFAAPDNAILVNRVSIENPINCPGWRLYFPREEYQDNSQIAKRINALEKHFQDNPQHYDALGVQDQCVFNIYAKVVSADIVLLETWPSLVQDLQTQPDITLNIIAVAMHGVASMAAINASLSQPLSMLGYYYARSMPVRKINARPLGFANVSKVADISNEQLDQLYCVRGCVTAVGMVETHCSWAAYKCGRCGHEQALKQEGIYQKRPYNCLRTECNAKNGFMEQRSSPYTQLSSVQIIRIVETHLQALNIDVDEPACLDVELRQEQVDSLVPGQDVVITGILRLRSLSADQGYQALGANTNKIQIYMQALAIEDALHLCQQFTERDLDAIGMINAEPDSFKLLVHSLAPEVYSQEMPKAGVLLALFGGAGSQLHDDAEINVLLVGDPGVGKSSLLHMVEKISSRGAYMSGKSLPFPMQPLSMTLQGRAQHSVQGGAIVSASFGHCAIDDVDRLAAKQETLLQVMQSQTLSLPFTGIFTNLKTTSAILATANPARGNYDHAKSINENIRLHPALLTQFHLVFVMLDKPNKDLDTSLTEHIHAVHDGYKKSSTIAARFAQRPKTNYSMNMSTIEDDDNAVNEPTDENYDLERRLKLNVEQDELDLLPPILIKKFIAYTRQKLKPLLTNEAALMLKHFYIKLKQQNDEEKQCASSTSQFEGLVRLAQARARIDFSSEVTALHVRDVLCIVRQSVSDTAVGDYVERNPAASTVTGSQNSMAKKFIKMLQLRSNALGRRVFDFDDLKDMARHAGISCGVTNLVEMANMQGFLLKKGPNIYEVLEE